MLWVCVVNHAPTVWMIKDIVIVERKPEAAAIYCPAAFPCADMIKWNSRELQDEKLNSSDWNHLFRNVNTASTFSCAQAQMLQCPLQDKYRMGTEWKRNSSLIRLKIQSGQNQAEGHNISWYYISWNSKCALYCKSSRIQAPSSVSDMGITSPGSVSISTGGRSRRISQTIVGPAFRCSFVQPVHW